MDGGLKPGLHFGFIGTVPPNTPGTAGQRPTAPMGGSFASARGQAMLLLIG